MNDLEIAVAGTGYVGMSIATLQTQRHQMTVVDIITEKEEKDKKISPVDVTHTRRVHQGKYVTFILRAVLFCAKRKTLRLWQCMCIEHINEYQPPL